MIALISEAAPAIPAFSNTIVNGLVSSPASVNGIIAPRTIIVPR